MRDIECQFISCGITWRHRHCNTSITFGTEGQNAMKKAIKFYSELTQLV